MAKKPNNIKPEDNGAGNSTPPLQPGDINPEDVRVYVDKQTEPTTDELDPEAIRLDPQYARKTVTKREQLSIPVDKPNKQAFFRVHPTLHIDVCLLENKSDGKLHLVLGDAQDAVDESELKFSTLYLWSDRDGNYGLWPAGLPYSDGTTYSAWESAHDVCQRAMSVWVRYRWNRAISAYDVITLNASVVVGEPQFPDLPLATLLGRAFAGRVIKTADHPLIRKLQGNA